MVFSSLTKRKQRVDEHLRGPGITQDSLIHSLCIQNSYDVISDSNNDHNLDKLFRRITDLEGFEKFKPQLPMIFEIYEIDRIDKNKAKNDEIDKVRVTNHMYDLHNAFKTIIGADA